jgi:hypothetical protein
VRRAGKYTTSVLITSQRGAHCCRNMPFHQQPTTAAPSLPSPVLGVFQKQFFSERPDAIFWSLWMSRLEVSNPGGF